MTYKYDPNLSCYLSRAAALKRQKNPKENSKRDLLGWLVGWLVRHAPIMAAAGDRLHPVHCAQAQVAHCSVLVTLGQ